MFVLLLHFYSSRPTPAYATIAGALRRAGHKVWIGQPTDAGTFVFDDGDGMVEQLPGPSRGRVRITFLPFMIRLRRRIRQVRPDVVQITPTPWSWILAAGGKRSSIMINDVRTAGSGVGRGMRTALVDWSAWISWRLGASWIYDRTVFLNDTGAEWLLGARWSRRADVIPLGVDPRFLQAVAPSGFVAGGAVRFLYIGTLSRARGLEQILLAAKLLARTTRNFHVTLMGPDDAVGSRAWLVDRIRREGLESRVVVADPVPYGDVPAVFQQFDVALNYIPDTRVQRRQPFMKVLECRALGVPQITTRTTPNEADVIDGQTGLLVDDSPSAYAAAMQRLVEDPKLLETLTTGARSARAGLKWDQVAASYAELYGRLRSARN